MDTEKSLYEIEVALAKSDYFNFVKNIVAFNVNGWGQNLPNRYSSKSNCTQER